MERYALRVQLSLSERRFGVFRESALALCVAGTIVGALIAGLTALITAWTWHPSHGVIAQLSQTPVGVVVVSVLIALIGSGFGAVLGFLESGLSFFFAQLCARKGKTAEEMAMQLGAGLLAFNTIVSVFGCLAITGEWTSVFVAIAIEAPLTAMVVAVYAWIEEVDWPRQRPSYSAAAFDETRLYYPQYPPHQMPRTKGQ